MKRNSFIRWSRTGTQTLYVVSHCGSWNCSILAFLNQMFPLAVGLECACFVWRPCGMKERGRLWCFCNDPPVEGVCSPFYLIEYFRKGCVFSVVLFLDTHRNIHPQPGNSEILPIFLLLTSKSTRLPLATPPSGAWEGWKVHNSSLQRGVNGICRIDDLARGTARCEMFLFCFFFPPLQRSKINKRYERLAWQMI